MAATYIEPASSYRLKKDLALHRGSLMSLVTSGRPRVEKEDNEELRGKGGQKGGGKP